jgi:hypothetical protein
MGPQRGYINYALDDEQIEECPVSVITPESKALVEIFSGSRIVHKQCGTSSLGDPSQWSGKMVDAATIFEVCSRKQEAEMHDAIERSRPP